MKIKTRRYYIYYALKTGLFALSLLPLGVGLFIADMLGKIGFRILGKYRNITLDNLNNFYGPDTVANRKIAEKVFSNILKNGAEWVKLYSMPQKNLDSVITEFEGLGHLDEVLSSGKGALVLGFHFGNWELLGMGLRYKGYPGSLVGRRIYFHKYDKLIVRMRMRFDAKTIYRDESPRRMLMELKRGRILGIVPDQDVDSIDGVFVDFFGQKAFTPTAPVKIAMAAGTKVVPIFVVRKKDNTHRMVVEKPIDVLAGDRTEEDVFRYTQEWTKLLEKYVRDYPEQWVWMHRRWKTRLPDRDEVKNEVAA